MNLISKICFLYLSFRIHFFFKFYIEFFNQTVFNVQFYLKFSIVFTALHVKPPTAQGLIGAIESKYKISGNSIRFLFKQNREGHKVKIDDDMITYYSNEAAFLMQVKLKYIFCRYGNVWLWIFSLYSVIHKSIPHSKELCTGL